jgi:hypothetical protein
MGFALMRHHRSWLSPATSICLLAGACGSTSTTEAPSLPTLVVVKPERFLGQVPCLDTEGAAKVYVATLEDVTPNLFGRPEATPTSFALPSSAPTSCHQPVGFGFVIAGHQYVADLQVYDRSDLAAAVTGSAIMLDPDGNVALPRWTTTCGQSPEVTGQGPTICASKVLMTVTGCIPLANSTAPAETVALLRPKSALGSLSCGDSAGQIASFVVVPQTAGLEEQTATGCDAELSYAGLEPGQGYTFYLYAYEPGATAPRWGTTCLAYPSQGVTVVADCDPLTDHGSLVVDLGAWLASAQQVCSADGVTEVTVSVFTPDGVVVRTSGVPDCALPLTFGSLLPGAYPIEVRANTGEAGHCDAVVMPGTTAVATCDPVGA